MPIDRREREGDKPTEPHLALLADESGMRIAIPPGASLWVIEDAKDQNKIFPLTLAKVSHKALTFVMQGKDGAVTEYKYVLANAKPLNRAALLQLQKNRQDLMTPVHKL